MSDCKQLRDDLKELIEDWRFEKTVRYISDGGGAYSQCADELEAVLEDHQ